MVEPGTRHCYPVFGPELPLSEALIKGPVAICIGYETEASESSADLDAIRSRLKAVLRVHLEPAGFDFEYAVKDFVQEDGASTGAIMLANENFRKILGK